MAFVGVVIDDVAAVFTLHPTCSSSIAVPSPSATQCPHLSTLLHIRFFKCDRSATKHPPTVPEASRRCSGVL